MLPRCADGGGPLEVRRAGAGDIGTIMDILSAARDDQERQGLPVSWRVIPREAVTASVGRGETYLIRSAEDMVGTLGLEWRDAEVWPDSDTAGAAYLHRLAVCPRHHGRGLGQFAVSWAEQAATARGRPLLRLDAVAANKRLCDWYERLGFTPKGEVLLPGWTRASMRFERCIARPPGGGGRYVDGAGRPEK